MLIITDLLREPFDEGAKNTVRNLLKSFQKISPCTIVSVNSNIRESVADAEFSLNKLLFSFSFYTYLRSNPSPTLLYIPEASVTFPTFVRAWFLRLFTGKKIIILSLQPRGYSLVKRMIIPVIKPSGVITQSKSTAEEMSRMGIHSGVIPLGVDSWKFKAVHTEEKLRLREKYKINQSAKVLLHVGHIRKTRNLGSNRFKNIFCE